MLNKRAFLRERTQFFKLNKFHVTCPTRIDCWVGLGKIDARTVTAGIGLPLSFLELFCNKRMYQINLLSARRKWLNLYSSAAIEGQLQRL